jgi:hypothetical protein
MHGVRLNKMPPSPPTLTRSACRVEGWRAGSMAPRRLLQEGEHCTVVLCKHATTWNHGLCCAAVNRGQQDHGHCHQTCTMHETAAIIMLPHVHSCTFQAWEYHISASDAAYVSDGGQRAAASYTRGRGAHDQETCCCDCNAGRPSQGNNYHLQQPPSPAWPLQAFACTPYTPDDGST